MEILVFRPVGVKHPEIVENTIIIRVGGIDQPVQDRGEIQFPDFQRAARRRRANLNLVRGGGVGIMRLHPVQHQRQRMRHLQHPHRRRGPGNTALLIIDDLQHRQVEGIAGLAAGHPCRAARIDENQASFRAAGRIPARGEQSGIIPAKHDSRAGTDVGIGITDPQHTDHHLAAIIDTPGQRQDQAALLRRQRGDLRRMSIPFLLLSVISGGLGKLEIGNVVIKADIRGPVIDIGDIDLQIDCFQLSIDHAADLDQDIAARAIGEQLRMLMIKGPGLENDLAVGDLLDQVIVVDDLVIRPLGGQIIRNLLRGRQVCCRRGIVGLSDVGDILPECVIGRRCAAALDTPVHENAVDIAVATGPVGIEHQIIRHAVIPKIGPCIIDVRHIGGILRRAVRPQPNLVTRAEARNLAGGGDATGGRQLVNPDIIGRNDVVGAVRVIIDKGITRPASPEMDRLLRTGVVLPASINFAREGDKVRGPRAGRLGLCRRLQSE